MRERRKAAKDATLALVLPLVPPRVVNHLLLKVVNLQLGALVVLNLPKVRVIVHALLPLQRVANPQVAARRVANLQAQLQRVARARDVLTLPHK